MGKFLCAYDFRDCLNWAHLQAAEKKTRQLYCSREILIENDGQHEQNMSNINPHTQKNHENKYIDCTNKMWWFRVPGSFLCSIHTHTHRMIETQCT